jgi:hypothetical protein
MRKKRLGVQAEYTWVSLEGVRFTSGMTWKNGSGQKSSQERGTGLAGGIGGVKEKCLCGVVAGVSRNNGDGVVVTGEAERRVRNND